MATELSPIRIRTFNKTFSLKVVRTFSRLSARSAANQTERNGTTYQHSTFPSASLGDSLGFRGQFLGFGLRPHLSSSAISRIVPTAIGFLGGSIPLIEEVLSLTRLPIPPWAQRRKL